VKEINADRVSLAEQVYDEIRNAIILGDLIPGSLHSVQEIASQLKVSRTPAREALLKLADQGMVRFERNRGARILETSVHDLEQVFSLRLLLEVPATYRATSLIGEEELRHLGHCIESFRKASVRNTRKHLELDAKFHRIIMRACGNRRLADFVDTLRDLQMMRGASTVAKTRTLADVCDDHQRIFERIVARDPAGAASTMRDHIALTSRLLIAQETGETEAAEKFESAWVDLLSIPHQPRLAVACEPADQHPAKR
jgi:DNA-binding GntR family transcriptional regulator